MISAEAFLAARDFLLAHRDDYERAYAGFEWPRLARFNWALDFFDRQAEGNDRPALRIVDSETGSADYSFLALRTRSNQVANLLRDRGVRRGERVFIMLPNIVALWEVMLAAMKLGAVVSPASMLLSTAEIADRVRRGRMRHLIVDASALPKFAGIGADCTRIAVGGAAPGWIDYEEATTQLSRFEADGPTRPTDPFLLYFTSGTTAQPKMVLHSFESYPVGHLSTMYWIGLQPGDIHWNISSPGWAKHAWSCFFAPWNAGATVYIHNQPRFDAKATLEALVRDRVTSLCAPPTVWRALILEPLASYRVHLRELVGAGEPLNPEVIEQVRAAWGLIIRDGYGQTETTCVIGNSPGQPVKQGSMGRPLPGYRTVLLDETAHAAELGEINISLGAQRPSAMMLGYAGDEELTRIRLGGEFYPTSDVARQDADGYYWYVGRNDDVFKSSDYRISPFELESLLLEHDAVAEAAVVPSPDARRLAVPKAFVVLRPHLTASAEIARSVLSFIAERAPPYKRIRRIEFCDLPKTTSGKIRRVELRQREETRDLTVRAGTEFWEEDLRL
ncbi:MAG TPA: AMP-binding protein [Steroidobacteraceae bacterium]|nr:AMP-binding protein [Steroidobacteraceae bacterium]